MEAGREPLPTRIQDTAGAPARVRGRPRTRPRATSGSTLDASARAAIDGHVRLLLAWTHAINLTAIREPAAIATAHVVDSLSAVPLLRERAAERVLDLGSGGGFPGLPIAAAMPGAAVDLAEPIGKKAGFLRTVVEATGLAERVTVHALRAEALAADPRPARVVVGRHRARRRLEPPTSSSSRSRCSRPGGVLVAWKRGDLDGGARRPRGGRSTHSAAARSRCATSRSPISPATAS